VALALTTTRPAAVSAIVAFAPPLYRDRGSARHHVARSTSLGGLFALDTPTARAICTWHEAHPEAARMIAPLLRPDLPAAIARDAVRHTWASYSQTLVRLILDVPAVGWLPRVAVPVYLIAGADDDTLDLGFLEDLARRHPQVSLTVWPGAGHHLPLTHPEACLTEIRAALSHGVLVVSAPCAVDPADPGDRDTPARAHRCQIDYRRVGRGPERGPAAGGPRAG
jgi:pimeloyl-ACP methyl ester carboxylesterase